MAWGKLTSKTLTVSANNITTDAFTAKKFNQFLQHSIGNSYQNLHRFNGDSGTNYAARISTNGGADATDVSTSHCSINFGDTTDGILVVIYECSILGQEKLGIAHAVKQNTAGAGTAPQRAENVHKYIPSPDADITIISVTNGLGSYTADSNLTVLGTTGGEVLSTPKIQTGCEFHETDTNKDYVWNGSSWVYITP